MSNEIADLKTWLDESIEQATEELVECNEDDPNSYASGYEAGTLSALLDVKSKLAAGEAT